MNDPKTNPPKPSRIIYLTGQISEATTKSFAEKLFDLEVQDPYRDILVYIDSYGGSVDSFIAMHDAMKLMRCPVATVCLGKAMSAALMLLISGTKGRRFITRYSRTMMHEVFASSFGKLAELDNDLQETKRMQKVLEKLVLRYTKVTKANIDTFMRKDTFFDAEQSLKFGLVDHIIDSPANLYKVVNV
jgi:ATP-dependent Clp protease protease subunit